MRPDEVEHGVKRLLQRVTFTDDFLERILPAGRLRNSLQQSVRLTGCARIVLGALVFLLPLMILFCVGQIVPDDWNPSAAFVWMIVACLVISVVPCIQGAMEILTGISFWKMSAAWDSLRGWQRLIIGLIVVPVGIYVLGAAIAIVMKLLKLLE